MVSFWNNKKVYGKKSLDRYYGNGVEKRCFFTCFGEVTVYLRFLNTTKKEICPIGTSQTIFPANPQRESSRI
jgi:hypothetical protein